MQGFRQAPLKDIQKWSPASSGQPLFNNLFVFQRNYRVGQAAIDLPWSQIEGGSVTDDVSA
jgi:ferricrocin synthase